MILTLHSKISKVIFSIVASLVICLVWQNTGYFLSFLNLPINSVIESVAKTVVRTLFAFLILSIVVKPREECLFLGLDSNFVKGLLVAIISVIPLYAVFPFIGDVNPDMTLSRLARKCLMAGFIEELLCRAFMFGLFFRYAKVGFLWATLLPALLFGVAHLYQGHDILSSLAAFGVTFIGAVYFSWMYVAWNFNLWVPVGLHVLMNAAWFIFNVNGTENAAGGLISNIVRVVSILLAIIITVYYHKKKGKKVFDHPIISF